MNTYDFVVIGGGIVGVSTAWQLKTQYPDARILLIEKENALARHQTGRNSGVIHAGVYYPPGSLKADFCKKGAAQTMAFCREHGLPCRQCGKLLVATNEAEYERMGALEQRCAQNGIQTHRLSHAELKTEEPRITGRGALLVPSTGITDYGRVTAKMAGCFTGLGGDIKLGLPVTALRETRGCRADSAGQRTVSSQIPHRLQRADGRPACAYDGNRDRFSDRALSGGSTTGLPPGTMPLSGTSSTPFRTRSCPF